MDGPVRSGERTAAEVLAGLLGSPRLQAARKPDVKETNACADSGVMPVRNATWRPESVPASGVGATASRRSAPSSSVSRGGAMQRPYARERRKRNAPKVQGER